MQSANPVRVVAEIGLVSMIGIFLTFLTLGFVPLGLVAILAVLFLREVFSVIRGAGNVQIARPAEVRSTSTVPGAHASSPIRHLQGTAVSQNLMTNAVPSVQR